MNDYFYYVGLKPGLTDVSFSFFVGSLVCNDIGMARRGLAGIYRRHPQKAHKFTILRRKKGSPSSKLEIVTEKPIKALIDQCPDVRDYGHDFIYQDFLYARNSEQHQQSLEEQIIC